jgi:anaerobic selenocysteine-containing dehydrogenase
MNVRAIVCLPALVGAYGKPGGGCFTTTSASKAFDMKGVTREDFQPRPTRLVNMNQLGDALTQLDGPRVMSLYVYTSNPAAVAPDQNAVLRGLAREDLFTVVHERFLTDTARYADILLPATTSLEHADLYRSYGQYAIQRARPAIPPVGEAKSNWEVFKLLAEEMGFHEPFFRQSADDLIELLLSAPSPMREGIDRRALDEGKAVGLAIPAGATRRWATPSGRIEILNPALPQPLPCRMPMHEENGTLPFQLVMGVTPYSLNSSFQEREELRQQQRGMRLGMNPADAEERGLRDGERVVASNALGEVVFVLEVTPRVPRGRVVAEGVFWLAHVPGDRNVNALTAQRLTDMAGGSTFSDNRVDVRRGA